MRGAIVFVLFLLNFQLSCSISVEHIATDSVDFIATESLTCVRKYFEFHFKEMDKARLNLILEPRLRESRFEQLFLQESNEQFMNPIILTTIASIDDQLKNYLIFLSSEDIESLKNISISDVHDDSFLYVFYERMDENTSVEGILFIFTPIFGQNIVIMMTSADGFFEWKAFRLVLHRCMKTNVRKYILMMVSQCRGENNFSTFPLMPTNTEACPLQVAGAHRPSFSYYDPKRGFHNGFEYHLVRLISDRMRMPINFTLIDYNMRLNIIDELLKNNKTFDSMDTTYARCVLCSESSQIFRIHFDYP